MKMKSSTETHSKNELTLNGYRPSHRNKWRLVQYGILNIQELALLEFYADIVVFDKKKPNYGSFKTDFGAFAKVFNCKSENTVRNWHSKLLELGFIKRTTDRNIYHLLNHERYISPGWSGGKAAYYVGLEKNQPIGVILQNLGVSPQSAAESTDEEAWSEGKITTKALGSYKDGYEDNTVGRREVVIQQEVRTAAEYQNIFSRGNYQSFTPEDMLWTDENTKEEIEVPNEETEKEIVHTYFNDNWDEYRKHLITG